MVSSMLLSRFRSYEEYGTYSQLMMVINLVTTIIMIGLPNSLNYFLGRADDNEEKSKFLSVYYTLNTLLSFLTGIVLVAVTPLMVSYFKNSLIKNFIYFLAIFPWTKIICSSVENVLVAYQKTNYIMLYRILNSVSLLAIIVLVELCSWTFTVYMVLYLAVEIVFCIWVYLIVKGVAKKFKVLLDKNLIKEMLKFSIPIGLASMVGTLNIELDKLVVGRAFGTEQLAIYTNAAKEMPVTIIASSLTAILLPQMARLLKKEKTVEAMALWRSATTLSFIAICFLSFGLIVFAEEAMTVLYSEKYLPGVNIFRIYCLVLLLRCTYFGMILNASGKTNFIFISSVASLVLNVILNLIFTYFIGIEGPAWASLVAQLIVNIAQLIYTARIIKVSFKAVFPWKASGITMLINTPLAIGFGLAQYFLEKYLNNVAIAIVLAVIWGGTVLLIQWRMIKKNWKALTYNDVPTINDQEIINEENNEEIKTND